VGPIKGTGGTKERTPQGGILYCYRGGPRSRRTKTQWLQNGGAEGSRGRRESPPVVPDSKSSRRSWKGGRLRRGDGQRREKTATKNGSYKQKPHESASKGQEEKHTFLRKGRRTNTMTQRGTPRADGEWGETSLYSLSQQHHDRK